MTYKDRSNTWMWVVIGLIAMVFIVLIVITDIVYSQTPVLEIDQSLKTSVTASSRVGGVFTGLGWRTKTQTDYIQWNIPTCNNGVVEFEVKGVGPSNITFPNPAANVKFQLFNMWDRDPYASWRSKQDHNPWKVIVHLFGYTAGDLYKWRYGKFRVNVAAFNGGYGDDPHAFEYPFYGPVKWKADSTYHVKVVWGNGRTTFYLSDKKMLSWDYSGFGSEYEPPYHSMRIGNGNIALMGGFNCPIGITYSNFKFYRIVDTTPPQVVNFETEREAGGLTKITSDVMIQFSKPMDTAKLLRSARIEPAADMVKAMTGNVLVFKNLSMFAENYIYTINLGDSVYDKQGNKLDSTSSRTYQFTSWVLRPVNLGRFEPFDFATQISTIGKNRYMAVNVKGEFTHSSGKIIALAGYWDGNDIYKVRFMPTLYGQWSYKITNNINQNIVHGTFECVPSPAKGIIQRKGYGFCYSDSTYWQWLGDTSWRGYTNLLPYFGRWREIIDLRAGQGYTAMQSIVNSYINGPKFWANEGGLCHPLLTATSKNYSNINPEYFQWIDYRIEYALSKGIVPVMLFSWAQEYGKYSAVQWDRFIRYLVARYAAKNVVFVICGEYNELPNDFPGRYTSEFAKWGLIIDAADPYGHIITLHPTGKTSCGEFGRTTWLNVIMQQTPYSSDITRDRVYGKPVVDAEPRYFYPADQNQGSNATSRYQLWETVARGGYYTSGFFNTYAVDKGGWSPDALPQEQEWVSFLNKFILFNDIDLTRWKPTFGKMSRGQLLTDGVYYFGYTRTKGAITVTIPGTGMIAYWFIDPVLCQTIYGGQIQCGVARAIVPPFNNDFGLMFQ